MTIKLRNSYEKRETIISVELGFQLFLLTTLTTQDPICYYTGFPMADFNLKKLELL